MAMLSADIKSDLSENSICRAYPFPGIFLICWNLSLPCHKVMLPTSSLETIWFPTDCRSQTPAVWPESYILHRFLVFYVIYKKHDLTPSPPREQYSTILKENRGWIAYRQFKLLKHTPQVIYVVQNVLGHNILNNVFQYTKTFNSTVLTESWHIIWGCRLLADRHGTVEYTLLSTASRQRSLRVLFFFLFNPFFSLRYLEFITRQWKPHMYATLYCHQRKTITLDNYFSFFVCTTLCICIMITLSVYQHKLKKIPWQNKIY